MHPDRAGRRGPPGGLSAELRQIALDLVNEIEAGNPDRRVRSVITLLVNSPEFVVQK